MKSKDIEFIIGRLLNWYKQKYPQKDCDLTNCCGVCDKYFACIYTILENIIKYVKISEKELDNFLKRKK